MSKKIYKTSNEKINYNDYVGKFFQRDIESTTDRSVCEINSFDGKYFRVTEYYLTLGFSTKEINQKRLKDFVIMSNFKEITKEEFEIIKNLCLEPFVTVWDENDIPYYCRELRGKSK